MIRKIIWLSVSCLMAISLVMASCGTKVDEEKEVVEEKETAEEKETVKDKETAEEKETVYKNWWDKFGEPKYGGSLTFCRSSDINNFDTYHGQSYPWLEPLGTWSWTVDRNVWSYKGMYLPDEYFQGVLAESWEQPDPQTFIIHLHEGIRYWDKPPVNGRELTAYDIEYGLHRNYGLGSGYTQRSPYCGITPYGTEMESVTATDKYTVVFKWKVPSVDICYALLDRGYYTQVEPRELIENGGSVDSWEDVVGSAPLILTDYVASSSITFERNPDYWGYDERHPENQVPYVDKVKWLIIPDVSTRLAALRAGKIDALESVDWEQAIHFAENYPELLQARIPVWAAGLDLRCDTEPYTDVQVRKALQMAINFQEIAETHYGGTAEMLPYGPIGPSLVGYYTPFDEWPEEVKEGYIYNPEGAKEILADAGYPDGFHTNIAISTTGDVGLMEIICAYFSEINVEMELKIMEPAVMDSMWKARTWDQIISHPMISSTSQDSPVIRSIARGGYSKSMVNLTLSNDPYYDQLYEKYSASLDTEERKSIAKEADLYALAQHWRVTLPIRVTYNIYSPKVKGYADERWIGECGPYGIHQIARLWIDE